MNQYDHTAVIIYLVGGFFWVYLWHLLVGFRWLKDKPLLHVPFFGGIFVFGINSLLSLLTTVPDYDIELKLYPYVEENAKTVASLSLAIAIFVFFKLEKSEKGLNSQISRKFLSLILWSFLLAVIGCLPLYWVPPIEGWLTVLRHLKTVPFTYSIFILSSSIILFIYEANDTSQPDI